MELKPFLSDSSQKTFLPSFAMEMLMCIPLPAIPKIGFGINVACSPCLWAIVFTASLKVITRSAVVRASPYLKSISCCPRAHSWWEASISKPICSRFSTISRRTSSPGSTGPISKYPASSKVWRVGFPWSSFRKRKNSHSGPTLKV